MRKLPKRVLVDVRCERCHALFEEFIVFEQEDVACPQCSAATAASLKGLGVHAHNRSQRGSASSWTVK